MCQNCVPFENWMSRCYRSDVESFSHGVSGGRAFVHIRLKNGGEVINWEAELTCTPTPEPVDKQEQKPFIAARRGSGKHLRFAVPV